MRVDKTMKSSISSFFSSSSSLKRMAVDSILSVLILPVIVIIRKDETKSLEKLKLKKIWCLNLKV